MARKRLRGSTRSGKINDKQETYFDVPPNRLVRQGPSNFKPSFFKYLIESKGGSEFLLDTLDSVTSFAGHLWRGNKTYQKITRSVKYTLPAYFLTKELIDTYKEYKKSIEETRADAFSDKMSRIMYYLGVNDMQYAKGTSVCQESFHLGEDVTNWIFSRPKTEGFKIKGFYENESHKKITDMFSLERGGVCILIEYKESTFVWDFNFSRFEEEIVVHESTLHFLNRDESKYLEVRSAIFKEFMKHFDIENNVLNMKLSGLSSRPRLSNIEDINQFDISSLAEEIIKVLERGLKRGYVLVGIPGVGKSTIIRKLEEVAKLRKFPFVYIDKSCLNFEGSIKDTFNNLRNIQPFIAIMEDADSADFRKKDGRLGAFLNEVDGVNQNLNGVIIMTINDTSLMHYTVINRPGRFDEVIMVLPPQNSKEVYEVLSTQYNKRASTGEYLEGKPFLKYEEISKDLLDLICKNGYTQADICEVLEKALLIDDELSDKSLKKSFENLRKSKKAIKDCNFRDLEPPDYEEEIEESIFPPIGATQSVMKVTSSAFR